VGAKTGNDNQVIILANYQHFGLVDTRHKGLEENTRVSQQWNTSLDYISTIHWTSFCGLEAV
jgi:hypothetical protein